MESSPSSKNPFQHPPEDPVAAERRKDIQVASDPGTKSEVLHTLLEKVYQVMTSQYDPGQNSDYQFARDCAEAVGRNPNAAIEDFVGVLKLGMDVTDNPALPLYLLTDPSPSSWYDRLSWDDAITLLARSPYVPTEFARGLWAEADRRKDFDALEAIVRSGRWTRADLEEHYSWLRTALISPHVEVLTEQKKPIVSGFLKREDVSASELAQMLRVFGGGECHLECQVLRRPDLNVTDEIFEYAADRVLECLQDEARMEIFLGMYSSVLVMNIHANFPVEEWEARHPRLSMETCRRTRQRFVTALEAWTQENVAEIRRILEKIPGYNGSELRRGSGALPELALAADGYREVVFAKDFLTLKQALQEQEQSGEFWDYGLILEQFRSM